MSAGTRSGAMAASASSAIFAWSASTITLPLSISGISRLTRAAPSCGVFAVTVRTPQR